jgi:hypothetical protein
MGTLTSYPVSPSLSMLGKVQAVPTVVRPLPGGDILLSFHGGELLHRASDMSMPRCVDGGGGTGSDRWSYCDGSQRL